MSSLALYRALIPAHPEATVSDDTVNLWLGLAARRHTASAWGNVFAEAMVFWAAHRIQKQLDAVSGNGAPGPLISQRDGDLSRTYAAPATPANADDGDLSSTSYGQAYLDLRNSRAATAPTVVSSRAGRSAQVR